MAEQEKKQPEKKPPEKKQATPKNVHTHDDEEKKPNWTIERCKKAARRFPNLNSWKIGFPSSYKAASAKGWLEECKKVVGENTLQKPKTKTSTPRPFIKKSA